MKRKSASFLIAFLLFSSMTFSMIVSAKADYSYDYTSTYFNYDVAVGDSFEYNYNFLVNITASSTFYNEMDTWLAAQNMVQNGFSSENFTNDLETFMEMNYKIKYDITQMYKRMYNYTYIDGSSFGYTNDIFNGSIRADLNEGNGWETPDVVIVDKLNDAKVFLEEYMNATEYAMYETEIDGLIDEVEDPTYQPDWDNSQIYGISTRYFMYYPNGTEMVSDPLALANGTTAPVSPLPDFGSPQGLPLFFQTDMNFEDQYDFLTDSFKFNLLYALEQGYSTPYVSTDTLQSILADGGVSDIFVDEKSVGIVWNVDDVNVDFFEEAAEVNLSEYLAPYGITDYTGNAAFAAEYDNDWALATFAVYAHLGITLDTAGISGAPQLTDEDISIDITFTIARDGINPPSEDNIKEGEIGDSRPFVIPGFPIWIVGLFGISSIAALVVKHRK